MKETPERVLDDLGRRVAELRRQAGFTQQQVADSLGMLVGDYQDIERGARNCTVRTLVHVARSLGVPTRALFDPPAAREPRQPGRPPTARELASVGYHDLAESVLTRRDVTPSAKRKAPRRRR